MNDRDEGPLSSSPGDASRALIRALDTATLATALAGDADEGWPYASLVLVACDVYASPILLISQLAEHTKNIAADDRVSLLYDGTGQKSDRLSGKRLSVLGRAVRDDTPGTAARYLARHPSAERYSGFSDFGFFRVEVTRAHLVSGFGRIDWIDRSYLLFAEEPATELAVPMAEAELIAEINEDHLQIIRYLAESLGLPGDDWRMSGCDPEGFDLSFEEEIERINFPNPVLTLDEARVAFNQMRERIFQKK
jgi:putative heme iron utilization protein